MLLFAKEHLAMKFLLVVSALLLSASPVFADESVYLECELQVVSQTTDKTVNKIINTEMVANVVQLKLSSQSSYDVSLTGCMGASQYC